MFGIGGTELLVILVVALLVLGPKSVPQIARTLGKAMGEFRRVSTEFQRTLNTEIAMEELETTKVKKDTSSPIAKAPDVENFKEEIKVDPETQGATAVSEEEIKVASEPQVAESNKEASAVTSQPQAKA